jgi:hypothetical protein
VEVLRDGQVLSLSYTLERPLLVIPPKPKQLSYFIVAGLVLLPLSMELLNARFFLKKLGDYAVPAALKTLELFCEVSGRKGAVGAVGAFWSLAASCLSGSHLPPHGHRHRRSTATRSAWC